jgi:thiamine-monophosphate kinase
MRLKNLGEFALIDRISKRLKKPSPRVIAGIGDDAAVLKTSNDKLLIVTTDTLVEGVHFDLKFTPFFSLGYKALSSNISDCAAMGGRATSALVTLGLPGKLKVKDVDELYRGISSLAKKQGIDVIGGDTVSSPKALVVSITLLGEVERKNLILRSGARVGDAIMVTGDLGKSAASLYRKHALIKPRVNESQIIAKSGLATTMIDNSDGLARCLIEICKMSKVGARVFTDKIPKSSSTESAAKKLKLDPIKLALDGGEDYELVFTVRKSKAKALAQRIFRKTKTPVTIVGEIIGKSKGIKLVGENGKERALKSAGYEHFGRN